MAANIVPQKVEDVDTQALSPMMQQYLEIKRQHPNEILFYRVGDFYEMFFDDALTASRELELTLTGKACGLPDRAPMCGVPFHSYEIYAARLIAKGYKVAICEQMEDPALAKGLVKRDIIRVITPGTVIESSMLADDKNNYICSIYTRKVRSRWKAGICFADISTGEAYATELTAEKMGPAIITELCRYMPSEILINPALLDLKEVTNYVRQHTHALVELREDACYQQRVMEDAMTAQLGADWRNTCGTCGHVLKCPNCSVPLVYHKAQHALLCHYCGHRVSPVPGLCPECGGKIVYSGFGTQKVEEELAELLPGARILRMDQDSTMQKNAHEKMLARFAKQEYDILLGTQMVAKGLDFGNVTLVGVLGIDSLLFGQGFRSYENVFSLITQVVGRGGRAELPGRALIQTAVPDHPVLQLAAAQDYPAFYQQEIMFRKFSLYPPFCSFCVVSFSGAQEMEVFQAARRFAAILGQQFAAHPGQPLRVLGPTPMNIAMISGKYRYKLTLKCRNDAGFRTLMHAALDAYAAEKLPAKAGIALDFNSDGD